MRRSKKLGAVALAEAKKLKATYADVRIVRIGDQRIGLRLSPERGTGKTLAVPNVTEDSSFGFGVRVIVNGAWGFASSPIVTPEDMTMKASRPRSGRWQACHRPLRGLDAFIVISSGVTMGDDAKPHAPLTITRTPKPKLESSVTLGTASVLPVPRSGERRSPMRWSPMRTTRISTKV